MSDLTVAATITRTELGLDPLDIDDGANYELVTAGPGARAWAREWAVSPVVHGGTQVSARLEIQNRLLVVRCKGSTATALENASKALVAAVSQSSFTLSISLDGRANTWKCFCADGGPADGEFAKFEFMARPRRQTYSFQVPSQPIPTAGVM